MKQRVITALILAPLAIAIVLLLPTAVFAGIILSTWLLALWEWSRLVGVTSVASRALLLVVAAACCAALWTVRDTEWSLIVIGLGCLWWLISLAWLRHFSFAAAPTTGNRALKLFAGLLVTVPAWMALVQLHGDPNHGPVWALFALMLVWAADVSALLVGRRFGRRKLAPRVSPGKTIAGAWGAIAGSALVAAVGGWLLGEHGLALVLLVGVALLAIAFSIVGDLFESLLKRQANVKDSGNLFPGHGGLLDRLDSVFAALPVFVFGKAVIDLLLSQ